MPLYAALLTVAFGPFGLPAKVRETDCDNQKVESAGHFWSEEPSKIPGRRRIRARIGGLHCSLCTGMIEKALGRLPGVDKVAVSLTHEQALIEYNPTVTRAEKLLQTLQDIGYTISDPNKVRPFEEEERALVRERRRFLFALFASIVSMGLVGYPVNSAWFPLCVFSIASLVGFSFVVLRAFGLRWAISGTIGFAAFGSGIYIINLRGAFGTSVPWFAGLLALILIFGVGAHIYLRRGIRLSVTIICNPTLETSHHRPRVNRIETF